jgi:hypothetical protein
MKMKTLILFAMVFIFAMRVDAGDASCLLTIGILQKGTSQVLELLGRPVTMDKLRDDLTTLGKLDSNLIVVVRVHAEVPAERLLAVLALIKNAGLKSVCVLPLSGHGMDILSIEIHPKTDEFMNVKRLPDLEKLPKGQGGGPTKAIVSPPEATAPSGKR